MSEAQQTQPQNNENKPQEKPTSEKTHRGLVLKQAREEKGISLETVHEATKIPMDALRAIEEGYTVRTLSEFYIKGFLKIYATYLEVDVSSVIDDYKAEELPKHIDHPESNFDIQEWLSKVLTRERKRQIVIGVGIFFGLFLLFKIITFFTSRPAKPKPPKVERTVERPEPVVQRPAVQEVKPVVQQRAPVAAPVVQPKPVVQAAPPSNTKDVTLTVRAKKSSWLRVKADGVVVFQSTLRSGAVETWDADEKIEISGRNISQLEFELNGKMIGSLGRADRRAKMLVVTKDGLSVTK